MTASALERMKAALRRRAPLLYQAAHRVAARARSRRALWSRRYEEAAIAEGESRSGAGSNLARTAAVRAELPGLLRELGVRRFLDLPCGDHHWMQTVELAGIEYVGADIVEELVNENQRRHGGPAKRFLVLDLVRDLPPRADLVLCRDCLVHLSLDEAQAALRQLRASGSTWLLATTFPSLPRNEDTELGRWRPLNLCRPPFSLAAPLRLVDERIGEQLTPEYDKFLGLWRL